MSEKIISKQRYRKRIKTCLECESYDPKYNRCKECGCFLLLKAALINTSCPKDKWND